MRGWASWFGVGMGFGRRVAWLSLGGSGLAGRLAGRIPGELVGRSTLTAGMLRAREPAIPEAFGLPPPPA